MKLRGRKIYCSSCKRIVRSREERSDGTTSILCNSCGKALYSWDGISWKYSGDNA